MDIAKQIIDQRVRKIVDDNPNLEILTRDEGQKLSRAFLLLGVAAYMDKDVADIVGYITEGGGDGGFDAAVIEIAENTLYISFFQAKYIRDFEKDSAFPANAVEKAVFAVQSIFDLDSRIELNEQSRRVVDQIRSYTADGYIPEVRFILVNNGLVWNQDGQNKIDNAFGNTAQVKFIHYNHNKILDAIDRKKTINTKIRFSGKAVGEQIMYKPVVIGRVNVAEISGLITEFGEKLLERNIRKYLGSGANYVNNDIRNSLLNDGDNFFYYNNGITMVCKNLRYNELQKEDWIVYADDVQIINGGQTCRTIHETVMNNANVDFSNTYVLVRMYAIGDDENVAIGITKATNTQNPIDMRDLHANEPEQRLLETSAKELGFTYKRKRDAVINTSADTITSSVAAEAVFTVWLKKPHLLNRKKHDLFSPVYYDEIFNSLNASQMIIAVFIYRFCDNMRRVPSPDKEINEQRAFSQYVLAAMIGKRLLNECGVSYEKLNHLNFKLVLSKFNLAKEQLYIKVETELIIKLKNEFDTPLNETDGRSLAAIFRRFEFVDKLLL